MKFNRNHQSLRSSLVTVARWITGLGFLLLYVPLISLVVYSFLSPVQLGSTEKEWSFHWYSKLFQNLPVWAALRMSLYVGFWSVLGATCLGTTAAMALVRYRFPGRRLFNALTYVPLIMPEMVMGLSLLVWFVHLKIPLGLVSMILAHTMFCVSYVIMAVKARLHGFDTSLEEAARDLGASPWQTFSQVTFPLISPGIFSGGLMAFTLSFDDFLITFFTTGVGTDTLPIKIYSMIKYGLTPEINALSTLLLLITLVLVILFFSTFKEKV